MKVLYSFMLIFFILTPLGWSKDIDLFFIERNKNKNEVHYQIHVDGNCRITSDEPITGYWKVIEEGPDKTRKFTVFDNMAYSIINQKVENNWVFFNLKALKTRLIKSTVKQNPSTNTCESVVQTKINNKWADLERIYVLSKEGFIMPKVIYVDVIGKSLGPQSEEVIERIKPSS